jgi:hypothetical protein
MHNTSRGVHGERVDVVINVLLVLYVVYTDVKFEFSIFSLSINA